MLTKRPDSLHTATFMSTSRDRSVAERFMGNVGGMLIELREGTISKNLCSYADVSWISKFPDEQEVCYVFA